MTEQQIWTLVGIAGFAALAIPAALRSGLSEIASAIESVRSELHEFNEARRLAEIIERSKKS
jgi:hypothetical protein